MRNSMLTIGRLLLLTAMILLGGCHRSDEGKPIHNPNMQVAYDAAHGSGRKGTLPVLPP